MPIAPFLALNTRNGTPQLKRYVNSVPAFVGNSFAAADNVSTQTGGQTTGPTTLKGNPPMVKFGGSQTFLAVVSGQVWRSTDGGSTWTSVFSMTGLPATKQALHSGVWVMTPNGVATAVIMWSDGNVTYRAATSTNGTAWTPQGPFTSPGTPLVGSGTANNWTDVITWDGLLYAVAYAPGGGGNWDYTLSIAFDPSLNTMAFAYMTPQGFHANVWPTAALGVFNDRLFQMEHEDGGTKLYELVGGAWTFRTAIDASGGASVGDCKEALFTDGTFLYAFSNRNAVGWRCFKIDTALTVTDITALVIPTALATAATTSRIQVIVDGRSTPGTESYWIMVAANGTTNTVFSQWLWNGNASFLGTTPGSSASTANSTGGDVADSMPFVRHSQGTTFWTPGENHIELKGMSPVAGGINVSFTLYSDTGTGTASVAGFFGTAGQGYPNSPATLTGTTSGLPLNNVTVNTVLWHAITDGFSSGQRAKFVLEQT